MLVIGLSGKIGSGKDYIMNHVIVPLCEKKGLTPIRIGFADQLKVNVMTKYNIPFEELFDDKTAEARRLLQLEGTRERKTDTDIWIKYVENWIRLHENRGYDACIIPDVRYKNEHDFIKKQLSHVLVRIHSPWRTHERLMKESGGDPRLYNDIKNHPSECGLDDCSDFDMIFHNDPEHQNRIPELKKEFMLLLESM